MQISYAQSNVLVEFKYLELTNTQANKDVIRDNYINAELISDSIIINQNNSYLNSHFYFELARAYKINDEYGMWAFSLLRQHILFPNDSLHNAGIKLFAEACIRLNISKSDAEKLYKVGDKANGYNLFSERLALLISLSIDLYDKDVDIVLLRYIYQYRKLGHKLSFKVNQWDFLTEINLCKNKKRRVIEANANKNSSLWEVDDLKLQKRVLMRAENHYSKTKAQIEADFYLEKYQELDLNIFNKVQVMFRKLF